VFEKVVVVRYLCAMKARLPSGVLLLVLALSSVHDLRAGGFGRRQAHYRRPPRVQNANQPPQTAPNTSPRQTKPAEQPQKFKDLPLNTVFYSWLDRDHKRYPWIKTSEKTARAQGTSGASSNKVVPVAPDLAVFVEKAKRKAIDETKSSEATSANKDGPKR
jgi:hypothetical protein